MAKAKPQPKEPTRQQLEEARSASFYRATQKKGMPMTYGTGQPPEKKGRR